MRWHPSNVDFLLQPHDEDDYNDVKLAELAIRIPGHQGHTQVQVIVGTSVLKLTPMSNQISEGAMTVAI